MSSTQRANEADRSLVAESNPLETIRDSVLLRLATAGAALVALGAILQEGVWAAILAVWGTGLLIVGLSLYGFIWWRRN